MRKRFLLFLVCCLVILLLTGCSSRKETDNYIIEYNDWAGMSLDHGELYAQRLEDLGLFGEHSLEMFKITDNNFIGKVKGGFFLVSGSINGEIHSSDFLKFAWHSNPQDIIISSLALEDIVITIDETKKIPTIQFKFTIYEKISGQTFAIAKGNPNILINSEHICYAKVRINSNDLKDEIYLPLNYQE